MEPQEAFLAVSGGDSIALCSFSCGSAQHHRPRHSAPWKPPRADNVGGRVLTHDMGGVHLQYAAATLKVMIATSFFNTQDHFKAVESDV